MRSRSGRPCVDGFHLPIHPDVASSFETAASRPPQDEVLDPHGEERGNAARLEPRGRERYAVMLNPGGIHSSANAEAQAAHLSPRPSVAGVLGHIAVPGLLADVVFFVVAMAPGGVDGNPGRAARSPVALVVLGDRRDGFLQLGHHPPSVTDEKTLTAMALFLPSWPVW